MVKIYQNGQTFLEENLSFLLGNKYASSLIIRDAELMNEVDKSNYLLRVDFNGKKLLALRLVPYSLLLFGNHECLNELLSFIKDNQLELPSILCSNDIGNHLPNFYMDIGMDFMECNKKTEPSSNRICHATIDDVDEIEDLSNVFFKECGLADRAMRQKIIDRIDSYRLIKLDGRIAALARHSEDTDTSSRISMVYTRKEYRGRGYAREVVNACKNEILEQGKIATLNVDQKNPISNHLYSSLGFKKVFSQGIYFKSKIYHIVAGEEMKKLYQNRFDSIPFNEDMSVGSYQSEPFGEEFIKERSQVHGVTPSTYKDKLSTFLSLINNVKKEDEIHLYFGEDQTCTANRTLLMNYFKDKVRKIVLHIVNEYNGEEISQSIIK